MSVTRILIANRGEVAIRVARAAADLGIDSVAVFSEDDAGSLHVLRAEDARALRGTGPSAYLDAAQIVATALAASCDAVHPGYGFLAERADFARRCVAAGLIFIGPDAEHLALFGDKAAARDLATAAGVPVLDGTPPITSPAEAEAFLDQVGGPIVIKAVAGGGGRGMRIVHDPGEIADALERCRSEAFAAFGDGALYCERFLGRARHIEVQVAADGRAVSHLWERDCTLQRRHQKVMEIAPAPWLDAATRDAVLGASVAMARAARYRNIGTFEFLVAEDRRHYFIEANARLQVEHTVTEEITGIDLVRAQILLAGGASLTAVALDQADIAAPRGYAVQLRVNTETMQADASVHPSGGTLAVFEPPSGPGIRVDTHGFAGYVTSPHYDSLLAKVVAHAHADGVDMAFLRASRALSEFRLSGVETNIGFLRALLAREELTSGAIDTEFVARHAAELAPAGAPATPSATAAPAAAGFAGARIDARDPLAVLAHGKSAVERQAAPVDVPLADGIVAVRAPVQGTVIAIDAAPGDNVPAGRRLFVMEAMKMEHVVAAPAGGRVQHIAVSLGDAVFEGHVLATLEAMDVAADADGERAVADLDDIRPDLAEALARHRAGLDESRPDAVARRRKTGHRTARENIAELCDADSFVEYGPLVLAAQRRRRPLQELIEKTPADGLVAGIGTVNAAAFGDERARVIAMSYDYTVLAGTQGAQNHRKKDRMFELAERWRLPIVFFTEGGGGRPGDTDGLGVAGLDCFAFNYFGKLSGLVPLVGITTGRCFAGNAALLGCCDVVIATQDANIGMGGPAMVEGGGLGVFRPEEIGPASIQAGNGVIDVLVADEAEAVRVAQAYLSYFQGPLTTWSAHDQRRLRHVIPENRRRMYDVREVIAAMADADSVLELRRGFGPGMVTALARIEGRPVGIVANNPGHLAGAIDSEGADKAARFMQLCDAFDLPLVFLCDTPGIMVGPEVEKTALVRHAARMFVTGASITVPIFTIILRKAYGLGAQAMAGGSFKAPFFCVSWPTGEFGGMGLEGAVKLGFRNELAAIEDPEERLHQFEEMVERMYQHGKAVNTASHFEIDDVIDPADSRRWITAGLRSLPRPRARARKKRPNIDTW